MLEQLKTENETLKNQAAQSAQGVQALLAQIDAHKQMLNEATQGSANVRTHLILFQKANQELNAKIEALTKQLSDATARIVELEKPVELSVAPSENKVDAA